ncbi:MAG TPA: helix-turn-helix transcriptional regulator [Nitrospiraceae bacterium]|nr:helix-turn-helix transcriptional regulator [Nitrospiraceae bacterium]
MKSPQQRFGVRVRQLRLRKGWTQEQLAERADRHWTYIGGIERGERNVTLTVITDIARALGVEVRALFPKDTSNA